MSQSSSKQWFYCRLPRAGSRVRLFCFPPAGAATVQFFSWSDQLPEEIEVHLAQLPGRERRRDESPLLSMDTLLSQLSAALATLCDRPFALFGHSMGALVAFEIARRLRANGQPTPRHLFGAGRRAPQVRFPYGPIHHLPDADFLELLQDRYGALPEALRVNPEMVQFFLPIIRADMALLETYQYHDEPPLDCPITAYGGRYDRSTTLPDLEAWRQQTGAGFRLVIFAGDHFFPQSHRDLLLGDIATSLSEAETRSA